jgi:hypothetical protein
MASESPAPARPAVPAGISLSRYAGVVMGLLSLGGAAMPVLSGLGFSERTSFGCYALAAALGGAGVLAWWAVTATQRSGRAQAVSWLAFPLAVLSILGMFPLLLAASFPQVLGILGSPDRLEAKMKNGTELEILFPRRMSEDSINLELDGVPVPRDWFRTHPGSARWTRVRGEQERSLLVIELEALRSELRLGPVRRVGLNRVPGVPQMLDASQERFQPQRIDLPPAENPSRAPAR